MNIAGRTPLIRCAIISLLCLMGSVGGSFAWLFPIPQTKAASDSTTPPLGLNVVFNEQSQVDLIKNDPRFEQISGTSLTEDTNGWPTRDSAWVLDNRYTFAWNPGATNADPFTFATYVDLVRFCEYISSRIGF